MIDFQCVKEQKRDKFFYEIVERVRQFWEKRQRSKWPHGGSSNTKSLGNEILLVLFYCCYYINHFLFEMHFGFYASNVYRYLKRMELLIAKAIVSKMTESWLTKHLRSLYSGKKCRLSEQYTYFVE